MDTSFRINLYVDLYCVSSYLYFSNSTSASSMIPLLLLSFLHLVTCLDFFLSVNSWDGLSTNVKVTESLFLDTVLNKIMLYLFFSFYFNTFLARICLLLIVICSALPVHFLLWFFYQFESKSQ